VRSLMGVGDVSVIRTSYPQDAHLTPGDTKGI
jgi:hypothetical protein